ncbi:nicotinate phosphoribosyltransferase [Allorhizobium sp. BGMRC 0089]|uniref:nicotinate phosphoribosyltransferase n=1 Tax=Allorhizobium sonneratiae TaxID=2934936 RepID=UPI0020338D0A|nr:nicotinate phosphoribosyltransferase [Allorhizobium sonneratiae]MCM2291670.1 nicotinate phosphoribosyltransferase [Allorhizobium sonneratiae]
MRAYNPILNTDSYKLGQFLQYPPQTQKVSGTIVTRDTSMRPEIVFFGLQMFLKAFLSEPVTQDHIDEAEELADLHGQPFDRAGWEHIVAAHGGLFPLRIEALPEGSFIHRGVPMVQIVNTDPACYWLPAYLETALLRAVWYPTTVASHLRHVKQTLLPFLKATCDDPETVLPTRLAEYGARGATSLEQAALGGVASLLHFDNSDTLEALSYARRYYGASMAGFSFPANDYTTVTAWSQDNEEEAYGRMIDQFGDYQAISVVSDSYDLDQAIATLWAGSLRERLRSMPALLVLRADSGDPIDRPVQAVAQLAYHFGTRLNGKGFKVLDDKVRVLQADGVSLRDMTMILGRLEGMGFSAENIAFGIGASQVHKVSRSTYGFTMKFGAIQGEDGRWRDMSRRPVLMQERLPEPGLRAVVAEGEELMPARLDELGGRKNHLVPVWENGRLLVDWSFDEIRARARAPHRLDV